MTRVVVFTGLALAAFVGCRAPSPTFAPYGPQTVPPPVTGAVGTPAPQPAPYYQQSRTTVSPQNGAGGWHSPSTNLSNPTLAHTQPVTNPAVNANVRTTVPNANFTSTQNQSFNAPRVTNPATIQGQSVQGQPMNNAALGTGSQSAQTQNWQGSGTTIGSPQLLNTTAPATQPSTNLGQPTTGQPGNTLGQPPQPSSQWGQPPINTGAQIGPNGYPIGGMQVNDATYGTTSPWSMTGVRNWFRANLGQPVYGTPAAYHPQPIYHTQIVPQNGYSTTAPVPAQLPVRGTQQNFVPATHQAPTASGQAAPVAPAAQWGSVPMATANGNAATVRGNDGDDGESKPVGFVTTRQASPTPHEAELYGHQETYQWLRGKLEFSESQQQWKLRYIPLDAPEGRMDSYGGSVVLLHHQDLRSLKPGDFVLVQGKLTGQSTGQSGFAPPYRVQSISKL